MPTFGGGSEKCVACSKTVYATEKIVVEDKDDKRTYHKNCLRCTHCAKPLSLGNYASMGGVMYCKPHFKQLFASKGNYDEGFGKDKLTSKWAPTAVVGVAPTSASSFVPVETSDKDKDKSEKKETPSSITSRFKTGGSEKCVTCTKTVYATERIVVEDKEDKKVFHKICFRCSHCTVVLTLGNYAGLGGQFFCKPHFKQLFASKGNYDEGFGKQKHSSKWVSESGDSEASATTSSSIERERDDSPIQTPPIENTSKTEDDDDVRESKQSNEEDLSSHKHSEEEEDSYRKDDSTERDVEPEHDHDHDHDHDHEDHEHEPEPERERSYDDDDDDN